MGLLVELRYARVRLRPVCVQARTSNHYLPVLIKPVCKDIVLELTGLCPGGLLARARPGHFFSDFDASPRMSYNDAITMPHRPQFGLPGLAEPFFIKSGRPVAISGTEWFEYEPVRRHGEPVHALKPSRRPLIEAAWVGGGEWHVCGADGPGVEKWAVGRGVLVGG